MHPDVEFFSQRNEETTVNYSQDPASAPAERAVINQSTSLKCQLIKVRASVRRGQHVHTREKHDSSTLKYI